MTDEDPVAELLIRVAGQDRAAFRELYSKTASKLLGVLLRILGNRAEAEDALQEVFTRIWLRAGRFDATKGRGMTWLIAIARNHAIDRLRARPDEALRDDSDAMDSVRDAAPTAENRLIALGEAGRIAECFATLEPDRAEAVRGPSSPLPRRLSVWSWTPSQSVFPRTPPLPGAGAR
jgi:RNA polymerase sigma-70 factor (ECF subfamily)